MFWLGKPKGDTLQDLGVHLRIILKCISKKENGERTGLIWLRTGTVVGSCERGDKPSGSTECAKFLDSPRNS